jgi:hypothetical protein
MLRFGLAVIAAAMMLMGSAFAQQTGDTTLRYEQGNTQPPTARPIDVNALIGAYDVIGTNSSGNTYRGTVTISVDGDRVKMKWSLSNGETYEGTGQLAGDILTVHWGAPHPVIYKVTAAKLIGTWDDGRATEDLIPTTATPPKSSSINTSAIPRYTEAKLRGEYEVVGTNPDGGSYKGVVKITVDGKLVRLNWRISNGETFKGQGYLKGNTLTIDWGQSDPVIYKVGDDGVLRGTWSRGRGKENLIPKG